MCDRITYCDVCECAECPRYGDDCDGDKRNDDLISRADAIEAVRFDTFNTLNADERELAINRIPSAEPSLKAIKRQIGEHWYLDPPSAEAVKAVQDCRNCKYGGYNDHWDTWFCYHNGECNNWDLWEPAEAVQGWRTGKPTENGNYMVTLGAWGHRYIAIMHYSKPQMPNREVDGTCWYRCDDEWGDVVYDDSDILAWMPLPKPYKGGDDE